MKYQQKQESFVCVGDQPVRLRYNNIVSPVSVYMYDYDDNMKRIDFTEGKDYIIENGYLVKLEKSALPDYKNSPFYNQKTFTHIGLDKYGNPPYMLFADYEADVLENEIVDNISAEIAKKNGNFGRLSAFFENFQKDTLELLIFGDSISVGGGTSDVKYAYFYRFAEEIERRYSIKVNITNKAIGGESSIDGMRRYKDVITDGFDLMILAYGMNDQNINDEGKQWFQPSAYKENLRTFIEYAKSFNLPVVLVSSCIPNPRWVYSSKCIMDFVEKVRELSQEYGLPYCDATSVWQAELQFKSYSDLLENDINHPSNYGHFLYFTMMKALLGTKGIN